MAKEFLAVEGMVIEPTNPSHSAVFQITNTGFAKFTIDGKKVFFTVVNVSITGANNGTGCSGASGAGIILATAQKTAKSPLGEKAVRENDSGSTLVSNPVTPCSFTLGYKITSAGQNTWKTE